MTAKEVLENAARINKEYAAAWDDAMTKAAVKVVNDAMATGLPFDTPDDAPRFDGDTYDPAQDHQRLGKQALALFRHMRLWTWQTLGEIEHYTGFPQASISARLRDFRKPRFGSHTVERRRRPECAALWEYRLIVNPQARLDLLGIDNDK